MKEKIFKYISTWEARGYPDGIPDEAPWELEKNNLVPSYRRICKAILMNDITLQSLGFSKPNCEIYNVLKRIELGIEEEEDKQWGLF